MCNGIISDLPTIYEMPEESVNWIKRMLTYTVAGGKMNRGLSLMAVQQTLAVADGRTLSNKVIKFEISSFFTFLKLISSGTLPISGTRVVC